MSINGDPRTFLDSIAGYIEGSNSGHPAPVPENRPVRLGTVDPYYTDGPVRVVFDGETNLTVKGYTFARSYVPAAGDRVVLTPVGQTYFITGKVESRVNYPYKYNLALQNGWTNYDTTYDPGRFTKTADGIVKLDGLIRNGTVTSGTLMATLPEGFRPPVSMMFPALIGNTTQGSLTVLPNGEIRARSVSATWTSLSNIAFPASDVAPAGAFSALTLNTGWGQHGDAQWGAPGYWRDSNGLVWTRGLVTNASIAGSSVATLPAGYTSDITDILPMSVNDGWGAVNGTAAGATGGTGPDLFFRGTGSPGTSVSYASLATLPVVSTTAPMSWTTPTLVNSWVAFNAATYKGAVFTKTAQNLVVIRGLVRTGSAVIFTLPAGYRPTRRLVFAAPSNNAAGRIDIAADGTVNFSGGSNTWISLNAVFVAEQ